MPPTVSVDLAHDNGFDWFCCKHCKIRAPRVDNSRTGVTVMVVPAPIV